MCVISVDTDHADGYKEHRINRCGEQHERSASLEFPGVRGGFNQIIKHRVPPQVAGAVWVAGATRLS